MDDLFARGAVESGLEVPWALYRQRVQRDSGRSCGRLGGTKLDFADDGIPKHSGRAGLPMRPSATTNKMGIAVVAALAANADAKFPPAITATC